MSNFEIILRKVCSPRIERISFLISLSKNSKNLIVVEDHLNKGSLSEKIKILLYENNIKIKIISNNLGNNYFKPKKTLNELFDNYGITKEYLEKL